MPAVPLLVPVSVPVLVQALAIPMPAVVRAGGGQLEPLNLSNPRPTGEHCLIKCGSDKPGDDASPDAEMWLNSTLQDWGVSEKDLWPGESS